MYKVSVTLPDVALSKRVASEIYDALELLGEAAEHIAVVTATTEKTWTFLEVKVVFKDRISQDETKETQTENSQNLPMTPKVNLVRNGVLELTQNLLAKRLNFADDLRDIMTRAERDVTTALRKAGLQKPTAQTST